MLNHREDYGPVLDALNTAIEGQFSARGIDLAVPRSEVHVRPAREAGAAHPYRAT